MILQATSIADLVSNLGLAAVGLLVLQMVVGLIPTILNRWFIKNAEYSRRSIYLKEKVSEDLCKNHAYLIDRAINSEEPIRGNGQEKPDLVNSYHKQLYKLHLMGYTLDEAHRKYIVLDRVLLLTITSGLILFGLVFVKSLTAWVLILSAILLCTELLLIYLMFREVCLLERYEHDLLKSD